jgi:hypothetical protein
MAKRRTNPHANPASKTVEIQRLDIDASFELFLTKCYVDQMLDQDQKREIKTCFICGMKLGFESCMAIASEDVPDEVNMLAIQQLEDDIKTAFEAANQR